MLDVAVDIGQIAPVPFMNEQPLIARPWPIIIESDGRRCKINSASPGLGRVETDH